MFDFVTRAVEQSGYLGIALLMFAENVFPPIPSEVIMPLAGYEAAKGDLHIGLVVLAGTAGSLAGVTVWYWLALRLGQARLKEWAERHGHWLTLDPADVDTANDRFRRHAGAAVFFGRLIPAVRTLISIPAGTSGMGIAPFLAYSAAGTALWTAALALAGYALGSRFEAVSSVMNPISNIVVAALLFWYGVRVYRGWRRRDGLRRIRPATDP